MTPNAALVAHLFVLLLYFANTCSAADQQQWVGVGYAGGFPELPRLDTGMDHVLTITAATIRLTSKDNRKIELDTKQINGFLYGNEKHGRAWASVLVGVPTGILGAAVFNKVAKAKSHFVAVDFNLPDGAKSSLLLRVGKENVSAILMALAGVTGKIALPESCVQCGPHNEKYRVDTDKKASVPLRPSPGKALIYVIRIYGGNSPGRQVKLAVGGKWVGINHRLHSYFWYEAEPGLIRMCSQAANKAMFHLYARPDHVYYLEQKATIGDRASFFNSGTDLVELSEEQGRYQLAKSSPTRIRLK
jgi:hypothetical protein